MKSLLQGLDPEPIITPNLMKLTRWMADYYVAGGDRASTASFPPERKPAPARGPSHSLSRCRSVCAAIRHRR